MRFYYLFLCKILVVVLVANNTNRGSMVHAQPGYFPICHVCPGGDHGMKDPNGILDTGLSSYKCSDARNYGLKRELGHASCLIFQMYANLKNGYGCDCTTPVSFPVENTNPVCNVCPNLGNDGIIYPGTDDLMVKTTYLMEMPCEEIYYYAINQWLPKGSCQAFQNDAKDICCIAPSNDILSGGTSHEPGNSASSSFSNAITASIGNVATLGVTLVPLLIALL